MKKAFLVAFIIIVTFTACNTQSKPVYTENEKALAEHMYSFALNHVEEEDYNYLMMICLFPTETGGYLEFIYSNKQQFKNDKSDNPIKSLGYTTSYCYEIVNNKIKDEKMDFSLDGVINAEYKLMWYQDGTRDEKYNKLLDFARAISEAKPNK